MLKKLLSIITVTALSVSLIACSSSTKKESASGNDQTQEEKTSENEQIEKEDASKNEKTEK